MTMFGDMLRRDRERWGLSIAQAAGRFGVKPSEYREIESGTHWPNFDTYDRIANLFGWPQAFMVGGKETYK
jgi:transcriptional regulator with XRE-family HTH domain